MAAAKSKASQKLVESTATKAMHKILAASGLGPDDAKTLGMVAYTAAEAAEQFRGLLPAYRAGFVIPYFGTDGKPTAFWRFRYLED